MSNIDTNTTTAGKFQQDLGHPRQSLYGQRAETRCIVLILAMMCMVGLSSSHGNDSPDVKPSYIDLFTADDIPRSAKANAARRSEELTEGERQELHSLLREKDREGAWWFALRRIVSARDTQSVETIMYHLRRDNNRYFALALAILGDKRAIPLLKEVMDSSPVAAARRDARIALRMLGALAEEKPPDKLDSNDLSIDLTVSVKEIVLGVPFSITATIHNRTDEKLRINEREIFFPRYAMFVVPDSSYVLRVRSMRFRLTLPRPETSYPVIHPGKKMMSSQECVIQIEEVDYSYTWPGVMPSRKSYILRSSGVDYDLFDYPAESDFQVVFVVDYSPISDQHYRTLDLPERLSMGRAVSNSVKAIVRVKDREAEE